MKQRTGGMKHIHTCNLGLEPSAVGSVFIVPRTVHVHVDTPRKIIVVVILHEEPMPADVLLLFIEMVLQVNCNMQDSATGEDDSVEIPRPGLSGKPPPSSLRIP